MESILKQIQGVDRLVYTYYEAEDLENLKEKVRIYYAKCDSEQETIEKLIKTLDVLQVKINQYAEQVNPAMLNGNLKPEEINQLKKDYISIQETEKAVQDYCNALSI